MCTHVVCVPRGDHLFSSFVVLDHFGWMDDDDVSVREGERGVSDLLVLVSILALSI